MEDKKRDYKHERTLEVNKVKRYTVKVPLYMSKALDEKLKKENKTYSSIALEGIEKYLKKS